MEAAQAQSPASSGQSPAKQGSASPTPSQGGTGGGFDINEVFGEAKKARAEAKDLRAAFGKQTKDFEGTKQTLERVQKAFSGEEKSAPDPVGELEEQMDFYLEQAMEAKQRGQAIPLTTNLALRFFQSQIQNLNVIEKLNKKIEKLEGGVDQATDPESHVNNMAYAQMENHIQRSLDQLYGTGDDSFATKKGMYGSVINMISSHLRELQAKAPGQWDQVRRNPQALGKIVQNAVRTLVPPRALQLIEDEQLQNTPMKEAELWAAFREAAEIQDPTERRRIRSRIRQDILETSMNSKRKRR